MATNVVVERITEPGELMEGPFWSQHHQRLYFVDINNKKICSYDPKTGKVASAYIKNGPVGIAVPVADTPNKLIAACSRDLLLVTWDGENDTTDPSYQKLTSVDTDRSDTRINDGKVDSSGRLWMGTMELNLAPNRGTLYTVGKDFKPKVQVSPVSISNGLAWSLEDDVLYYIDSPTKQIAAYDYDRQNGTIKNKRIAFDLNTFGIDGSPDGMTIDTDGNLWIALFRGSQVIQVNPKQGKLLRSVKIPATNVTSVAFGGPQLDILYVTTATIKLTDAEKQKEPEAGCVFAVTGLGVKGLLPNAFRLRE